MKKYIRGAVVAGLVFLVSYTSSTFHVKAVEKGQAEQQLIIHYKTEKELSSLKKKALNVKTEEQVGKMELVSVSAPKKKEMIQALEQQNEIEFVSENTSYYLAQAMPLTNDIHSNKQWNLQQILATQSWTMLPSVQNERKIAVLDTGVDVGHEDLAGRVLAGKTFLPGNEGGNQTSDQQGHGTFVAGIIAAQANNQKGIAGVVGTANIRILPIKVMDDSGEGDAFHVAQGIEYAIASGVSVINMSMAGAYNEAVEAAINKAYEAGIVVVAAAGNAGSNADTVFPGALAHVISVGSVDEDGSVYKHNNTGKTVDLVAPGVDIFSTTIDDEKTGESQYTYGTGTSFAAPHVAAVVALYKMNYPSATIEEIQNALEKSAIDILEIGRDEQSGHGRLNAQAMLASVPASAKIIKPTPTMTISDKTTIIKGKTTPHAQVLVKVGTKRIGQGNATVTGDYSVKIPKQLATTKLTILAQLNQQSASLTKVVVDKTPPMIEKVIVEDNSTQAIIQTEESTKISFILNGKTYKVTANKIGKGTIEIGRVTAGKTWKLTVADKANNSIKKSGKVQDKTAPTLKISSLANNTTKLTVKTENNANVKLVIGKKIYVKTANTAGNALFVVKKNTAGTKWTVTTSDAAKNTRKKTGKIVDKIAPKAVKVTGHVSTSSKKITGKAEANSSIILYKNGKLYKKTITTKSGKFTLKIAMAKKGTKFRLYSKDGAGNQSKAYQLTVK
ncbi:MAG: S8 family serine peptidase [Kurthia sp.]|nr:S8 family serine peptidase [Candidatus Kurthia equi]